MVSVTENQEDARLRSSPFGGLAACGLRLADAPCALYHLLRLTLDRFQFDVAGAGCCCLQMIE